MPTDTTDLFPLLTAELIALLRSLEAQDWQRPTVAGSWRVRDVVGHLLDVDLRNLAGGRDGHRPSIAASSSFAEILTIINEANASGVTCAQRLSPRLLTDLLEVTGRWMFEYVAALPPHGTAPFSVAWADEERSENWMHIGREYTERWHHQMQIRAAVGAAGLLERRWLHPLLDLSVRAFRSTYKDVPAASGTAVVFEVDAEGENVWSVVRDASSWSVLRGRAPDPSASLRTDADTAWRILYNALSVDDADARVTITGNRSLAAPMLRARSVMV